MFAFLAATPNAPVFPVAFIVAANLLSKDWPIACGASFCEY